MKFKNLSSLILAALILSSCSTNVSSRKTSSLGNEEEDIGSTSSNDYGTSAYEEDPSLNLFDEDEVEAPEEEVDNIAAADSTAQSCLSNNPNDSAAQWACLSNSASNGAVGQDTIMGLAASSLSLMNSCGLTVRQEIIARMQGITGSAAAQQPQVSQLFQLAKVKLTQCYYRVLQLQSRSMQWAPYQSQVYNYNAGNIWNLMGAFQ